MMSSTHQPTLPTAANPNNRDRDHSHDHGAPIEPGEIAVGVIIGRASEYFDFFVYGIATVLVFPAVFFPFEKGLEGTLWSFVIFSFAFLARPLGTVISMAVQRQLGRQVKLTIALFVMGISTACIAFLPGYNSIGYTAIILLAVLRVGQGLAMGGSWDGLPSLLALNAPEGKRGWFAMLGQLGAPIGFILASTLFAYLIDSLSTEDFLDWGWRYTFYVAFAVNVVALFARLRLVATDEFAHQLEERELEPVSISELINTQGYNLVIGAFAALASYALFHLVTVFPLSWIKLFSGQSITRALLIQACGAVLAAGGIVASGILADRFGRRRVLGGFAILIGIFSAFVPMLLGGGRLGQDVFLLVGFILLGLSYGQATGAVTANFESKYRYTGAALTADLAWLIGAGFAPLVALGLSANFGLGYVSVYLFSGALCTLIALRVNRSMVQSDRD